MFSENLDLPTLAYGFFNMLRLMSYAPQMFLLAQDRSGAKAISISSWLIWTGANFTTAIYAWVRLADASLSIMNAFNTACCITVLALVVYKRTTMGQGLGGIGARRAVAAELIFATHDPPSTDREAATRLPPVPGALAG